MNPKILGFLALLAVVVGAVFLFLSNPKDASPVQNILPQQVQTTASSTNETAATPAAASYTLAAVAAHSTASSCWAAIDGKVYDLTSWINQHPGGPDKILSLCGTDGTAAFTAQHGGQRRPESELASFYIANLTQ